MGEPGMPGEKGGIGLPGLPVSEKIIIIIILAKILVFWIYSTIMNLKQCWQIAN